MDPTVKIETHDAASIVNFSPAASTVTLAKARKEVRDALDIIQSPGSFARWHLLKLSPAELGLHMTVDGVGAINFPLRDDQAKQIIAKAKQSPYGRGEETVVDTSVRNTWELDVGQFTLQESATAAAHNTGWSFVHQTARSVVIEGLGLTCDTSALRVDPYKMLLYEKGAHFKAHTDSPKIPGMFGTLVIVLPSEHEGGDLILKHRQQKEIFKSSRPDIMTGIGFMCWYTDVEHEVTPITSGYRWVLTYNLAIDTAVTVVGVPRSIPTAAYLTDSLPEMVFSALGHWVAEATDERKQAAALEAEATQAEAEAEEARAAANTDHLSYRRSTLVYKKESIAREKRRKADIPKHGGPRVVYSLDHHYTESNLSFEGARGRDVGILQALRTATDKLPVDIFLAILEKTEEGSCDDYGESYSYHGARRYDDYLDDYDDDDDDGANDDDDVDWHELHDIHSTEYRIKRLTALDGTLLAGSLKLQEDDLLQDDCFVDVDGKEISFYEGYSGNEGGPTATHAYQVSAVVIVPRVSLHRFLSSALNTTDTDPNYIDKKGAVNLESLIGFYSKKCLNSSRSQDKAHLETLHKFCNHLWGMTPGTYRPVPKLSKGVATTILCALVRMRDWEYFEKVVDKTGGLFDATVFFPWISKITNDGHSMSFAEAERSVRRAVLAIPVLSDALASIRAIVPAPTPLVDEDLSNSETNETDKATQKEWARTATEALLDGLESNDLGYHDGKAIVTHCLSYYGLDYVETRLAPSLKAQSKHTAFAFGYMFVIADKVVATQSPEQKEKWMNIYDMLAEPAVDQMNIPTLLCVGSIRRELEKQPGSWGFDHDAETGRIISRADSMRKQMLMAVESSWVYDFYNGLFSTDTPVTCRVRTKLSRKVAAEVPVAVAGEDTNAMNNMKCVLHDLWVPALQLLVPLVIDHLTEGADETVDETTEASVASLLPPHQAMFVAVLDAYLDVCVGVFPRNPPTLVRRTMPPCCVDCAAVNTFLANGTEQTFRIGVNKKRRGHIHQRLEANKVDCRHESERHTIPHTLVITKTSTQFKQARRDWTQRMTVADRVLQQFSQTALEQILGSDYKRIMSMERLMGGTVLAKKPVKRTKTTTGRASSGGEPLPVPISMTMPMATSFAAGPSRRTPSPNGRNEPIPLLSSPLPVRGTKRKADTDVVDLTEMSD